MLRGSGLGLQQAVWGHVQHSSRQPGAKREGKKHMGHLKSTLKSHVLVNVTPSFPEVTGSGSCGWV